jgi:NADPH2:quinone reductase
VRAVVVTEQGNTEELPLQDLPTPSPGAGELLVDVAAAGINFIDIYQRRGIYPIPTPFVLGCEGAGRIRALGEGVEGLAVGDRVAWASGLGSYAEQVVIPAASAVAVPDGLSDEVAAGALLQGMTAHYLVTSTYAVQPGDTVLIHAAAGGVGLLLTQLAKARGARVIGTVSTDDKEALAREAGADEILRYEGFTAEVRRLTDGHGVAVVYDGVGASTFEGSLTSLRPRGLLALFGQSSGVVPPFDLGRLAANGSLFITRPTIGHYIATPDELRWRADAVYGALLDGSLSLRIGGRYALADAAQAHRDLQARQTTGKLVLLTAAHG